MTEQQPPKPPHRTVLLLAAEDTPPLSRSAGAALVDADCGHRGWISPNGVRFRLGGGVVLCCADCVDPEQVTEFRPVPGAVQALNARFGVAATDQLMAAVRANPAKMVREIQLDNLRRRRPRAN